MTSVLLAPASCLGALIAIQACAVRAQSRSKHNDPLDLSFHASPRIAEELVLRMDSSAYKSLLFC